MLSRTSLSISLSLVLMLLPFCEAFDNIFSYNKQKKLKMTYMRTTPAMLVTTFIFYPICASVKYPKRERERDTHRSMWQCQGIFIFLATLAVKLEFSLFLIHKTLRVTTTNKFFNPSMK